MSKHNEFFIKFYPGNGGINEIFSTTIEGIEALYRMAVNVNSIVDVPVATVVTNSEPINIVRAVPETPQEVDFIEDTPVGSPIKEKPSPPQQPDKQSFVTVVKEGPKPVKNSDTDKSLKPEKRKSSGMCAFEMPITQKKSKPVPDKPIVTVQTTTTTTATSIPEDDFFGDFNSMVSDILTHGRLRKPVCLQSILDRDYNFETFLLDVALEFNEFGQEYYLNQSCNMVEWETLRARDEFVAFLEQSDFGNNGMLIIPSSLHSGAIHNYRSQVMDTIFDECKKRSLFADEIGKGLSGGFGNLFIQNKQSRPIQKAIGNDQLNIGCCKGRRLFGWVNMGPGIITQTFINGDRTEKIEVPIGHAIFYDEDHRAVLPRQLTKTPLQIRLYINIFIAHEKINGTYGCICKPATTCQGFPFIKIPDVKKRIDVVTPMIYPSLGYLLPNQTQSVYQVYPGLVQDQNDSITDKDRMSFNPDATQWSLNNFEFMQKTYKESGYFETKFF